MAQNLALISDDKNIFSVNVGEVFLSILEDLADNDEEVEENVGRFIWPTALPMMKHIREHILPSYPDDTMLLELGAGCGLLGMGLAATHKFNKVIISDHDDSWLQKNLDINSKILGDEVVSMRLDWGSISEMDSISNIIRQSKDSTCKLKLLIVASDILYNHRSHRKLVDTLNTLSSHSIPTRILIGFLNDRDNDEASFLSMAREVFGELCTGSKPIFVERKGKDKSRKIELRLIDWVFK